MALKVHTAKGDIRISNNALIKMIAKIATSCYGVMGFTNGRNSKILKSESQIAKGIKIKIAGNKLNIHMHIVTAYGINLNTVGETIKHNIKYQLEYFTGIEVDQVNVHMEMLSTLD